MIDLDLKYHTGFIVLCLLVGALYAFILYYKSNQFDGQRLKIILGLIRGTLISLLCFFLLHPMLKLQIVKKKEPITIVAFDNSRSIQNDTVWNKPSKVEQQISNFKQQLEALGEVKYLNFDESVLHSDSLPLNGNYTNISLLKKEVLARFGNQNIAQLILVSDGIYNQGKHPGFGLNELKFPVYTLGVGDTTLYPDLYIEDLFYNQLTYLGNEYPIEININRKKIGSEKITVSLYQNDTLKADTSFFMSDNKEAYVWKKKMLASKVGQDKITVISKAENVKEKNAYNNSRTVFVDVIDSRQKILFLSAQSHPDEAFFTEAFRMNDNYELKYQNLSDEIVALEPYNLIVFSGFANNSNGFRKVLQDGNALEKSMLFFVRNEFEMSLLAKNGLGMELSDIGGEPNQVFPSFNNSFNLFDINENWKSNLQLAPPIYAPYGNYQFTSGQTLYHQKIGAVPTNYPLIHFNIDQNAKYGFFIGEGFWRWKMNNFLKTNSNDDHKQFLSQVVKILSVKVDKSQFNLFFPKVANSNQEVFIKAEIYNEAFELNNEQEVKLALKGPKGEYSYQFSKRVNSYLLNLGSLEEGEYSFVATSVVNGENVEKTGKFLVKEDQTELNNLVADHQLLRDISAINTGKFFTWSEKDNLLPVIKESQTLKTISFIKTSYKDLIHQKWPFFLLVLLVSFEWFIRKRNGAY